MSNVHLSNGSPTLERMDVRLSDQPKPPACTCLFGQADHEELKKEFKGHLKAMEEASSQAWDFDFATYTPRPNGRYRWVEVDHEDLPSFYSAPERRGRNFRASGNNGVDVNGNHDCVAATPCRLVEEKTERSDSQLETREQHVRGQRRRASRRDSSCPAKRSRTCVDGVSRRPAPTPTADVTPQKCSGGQT